MTKKDMIDAILEAMPTTQDGKKTATRLQVETVIESFCGVAAAELLGGGNVTLQGIGKIRTVATKARTGRNPKTGAVLQIPAGKRLGIVAFKEFKEALRP